MRDLIKNKAKCNIQSLFRHFFCFIPQKSLHKLRKGFYTSKLLDKKRVSSRVVKYQNRVLCTFSSHLDEFQVKYQKQPLHRVV